MNTVKRDKWKNYILDGSGNIVPCDDVMKWSYWYEKSDRKIDSSVVEDCSISTVFLGLDHNYSGNGDPVLFETMVFVNDKKIKRRGKAKEKRDLLFKVDNYTRRYCSSKEALKGHREVEAYLVKEYAKIGINVSFSKESKELVILVLI